MNILLNCKDRMIVETLTRSLLREGDVVIAAESLEDGLQRMRESRFDVVILSDQLIGSSGLSAYIEQARALSSNMVGICLFTHSHQIRKASMRMKECLAEGWLVIQPGLSLKQVTDRLKQLIHAEPQDARSERNGIIQFLGTTPNIGTTVAAFGTAAAMSAMTERRVGYLCLNLKSAKLHRYLGVQEPAVTLDGLRPELKAGHLSADRLLRQCHPVREFPNLHVLYGNLQREQAEYYSVEEIGCLLSAASDAFDYCIVDTSAYWDNAATVGTMTQAGMRIMVTTPNLTDFQEDLARWCKGISPVFGLAADHFDLLVTQVDRDPPFGVKEIAVDAGMQRIGTVRKAEGLSRLLNEGRLSSCIRREHMTGSDLYQLANTILTLHGDNGMMKPVRTAALAFWRRWLPGGRWMGFAGR